jgi:hypothetical protein
MAEWLLAWVLASWGWILLRPEPTFLISDVYAGLVRLAPEEVWGWACVTIGTVRLVALIVNGIWVPPTYYLRSFTSAISVFFWFTITLGLSASNQATTGLAVYPWLLVLEVCCLYRTARDARLAQIQAGAEGPTNAYTTPRP